MTYEQKKAQVSEILNNGCFEFCQKPHKNCGECRFIILESISMVFLDDEQDLPPFIGAEMSSQYDDIKAGYLEAQQDMLEAGFKKVLEAGK
jgi:hypothetical protein